MLYKYIPFFSYRDNHCKDHRSVYQTLLSYHLSNKNLEADLVKDYLHKLLDRLTYVFPADAKVISAQLKCNSLKYDNTMPDIDDTHDISLSFSILSECELKSEDLKNLKISLKDSEDGLEYASPEIASLNKLVIIDKDNNVVDFKTCSKCKQNDAKE